MLLTYKDRIAQITTKIEDDIHYIFISEHESGRQVGYANFKIKSGFSGKYAWLNKIEIDECYQGKGYGKMLLLAFEKYCVDKFVERIEGKYYPENQSAVLMYKNNGYEVEKEGYDQFLYKTLNKEIVNQNIEKILTNKTNSIQDEQEK